MKQTLQLRLSQQLTMTPQLQQAIRLLQLSTLELHSEVQEALDSNMMLEVDEVEAPPKSGQTDMEADVKPTDIPEELPVDTGWDDIYDAATTSYSSNGTDGEAGTDFEAQRSPSESLRDHLNWQLNLVNLNPTDYAIATAIIDAVDDGGYLTQSVEDVLDTLASDDEDLGVEEVEAVLCLVQNFDPVGVAARNLKECLLLQLGQLPKSTPWYTEATEMVTHYLEALGKHDFAKLERRMGLDREDLQEVVALIQSLNPRPGGTVYTADPQYIVPDVFVRKVKGHWVVELNPDAMPKVRINSGYASLVRRADTSSDNTNLRSHLQEARWFIKSLQSRSDTLLKVATSIVERQRRFLEYGPEAMKPMVLHDIAEVVEMHESTISRVTTQKYMHTPRGIFELKYFFSSHVSTEGGGEASSTAIRALLKKLIAAENAVKPLSDNKLAKILSEQGINVARRTVAKYREAMQIPSSNERKRLV